jgi:hypothetical protein
MSQPVQYLGIETPQTFIQQPIFKFALKGKEIFLHPSSKSKFKVRCLQ